MSRSWPQPRNGLGFNGSDVRERRLCGPWKTDMAEMQKLQWVRRPRTPVMPICDCEHRGYFGASMGPTSENAGYGYADG